MSSAIQTNNAPVGASARPDGNAMLSTTRIAMIGLVIAGWLGILYVNHWHLGVPTFVLWIGWLSVVLVGHYLWTAGMSAALDTSGDEEDFWKPIGERQELLLEKRSLLKALKEIEFDHAMGKMSDRDAEEISRMYKARAIEVIKTLERGEEAGELSLGDRIENEIKARLTVAGATSKAKAASKKKSKPAGAGNSAKAKKSDKADKKAKAAKSDEAKAKKPAKAKVDKETGESDIEADKASAEVES